MVVAPCVLPVIAAVVGTVVAAEAGAEGTGVAATGAPCLLVPPAGCVLLAEAGEADEVERRLESLQKGAHQRVITSK